jgi:c-di-AMP phosphodiesterase-like protein
MEKKPGLKTSFRIYLKWPIWMSVLVVLFALSMYAVNLYAGIIASGFCLIYLIGAIYFYMYYRNHVARELVHFATEYAPAEKRILDEMDMPYGLCDGRGRILWKNQALTAVLGEEAGKDPLLHTLMPEVTKQSYPEGDQDEEVTGVMYHDRNYRLSLKKMHFAEELEGFVENTDLTEGSLYAMCFYDETEILHYQKELEDHQLVAGLIYMDNYEEALEDLEDVRKSLLVALVDRKITQYFSKYQCILKKLEKDKYLFVVAWKHLEDMRSRKFSLLEETKSVNIGNDMAITISIGIGIHGDSFAQSYEYARMAIDLALGRGGDQVVLKDRNNVEYFGGKSHSMEKTTRVKARVKAHALRELIESKERVLVMGHHLSDVDSIGAAIGVYRATNISGKKAHIVLDTVIGSIKPLLERFKENEDYEDDLFITGERAKELVDDNTVVVVVDVNRPNMTECPELLKRTRNVVILDHHRQTSERIENAVLSYVEPYASSACEMVAEILQYYEDGIRIKNLEADAMYAGIVIDTDHFKNKTGIRTFEAAAFLRRNGADVTRVRKMFRDDMQDYKLRANAIHEAEIFMDTFAISTCTGESSESMNVVAAQAANELLNIRGIQASFVLAEYENKIYISARSIDEVNVQIIMEKMGGGGHMSIAGAQVPDKTIEEVKAMLKDTIAQMRESGAI